MIPFDYEAEVEDVERLWGAKGGHVNVSAGSLSHFRAEMQVSRFWRVL